MHMRAVGPALLCHAVGCGVGQLASTSFTYIPRRPYFRGIDFEGDVLRAFDALPGWMRAVRDRASCQESICPEGEMLDAAKRYYVSYLSPGARGRL